MDHQQASGTPPPPALSDAIEKLMANPQLISMVASALGGAKPPAGEETEAKEEPSAESAEPALPSQAQTAASSGSPAPSPELGKLIATLSPLLSGGSGGGKQDDRRACLLRALKPYVSPHRQEAIDTMIRLSQISDVLRHLQ